MANALEQLVIDSLTRGMAEGKVEGQREALLAVLASRFGAVPAGLREQIAGLGDLGALQGLVVQAATAATLEEFARRL